MTTTTPFMGLALPDDHGSADVWDTLLDAVFAKLDAHDHSPGNGALVPVAGLNVNANVQLASAGVHYAMYDALAFDFFPSAPSAMTSFAGALFMSSANNELYWRTAAGANVQLTNGAALNVAAFTGGIGGDYTAVGALESYDDATHRYLFQQQGSPRPWAGLAAGNVDIYQQAASIVNRVRLQSPAALAASYALTLFAALPASAALVTVDNAGVMRVDGVLGANQNLTLSGTGHVIRDTHKVTVPFGIGVNVKVQGGGTGVVQAGGTPGYSQGIGCEAYYPIPWFDEFDALQSIEVLCNTTTGSLTTYEIVVSSATGVGFVSVSTPVNGGGDTTVAVTTPATIGAGNAYWMHVTTGNAPSADRELTAMVLTLTTPP